jgi:hypothetical protein
VRLLRWSLFASIALFAALVACGNLTVMFWVIMFALPFVVVATKQPRKPGLALAVSITPFAFLLTLFFTLISMAIEEPEPGMKAAIAALLVLFAAAQTGVMVGAIGAYRSMPREPKDTRTLVFGMVNAIVWYGIFFVLGGVSIPSMVVNRKAMNENVAASRLRTLNVALAIYAQTYPEVGLPASLTPLTVPSDHPTSQAAALIAGELACEGVSCSYRGYTFDYRMIQPTGPKSAYTITARPMVYRKTGIRSFFTDETGHIRFTRENRAATVQDPEM